MSTEDNKTLYRQLMQEVFSQGNSDSLDELMTPDAIEHEVGPAQGHGLEGVKVLATILHSAFPDLYVTIEDMTAEGDKVWARITFHGTNTDAFMGMPPTGKRVNYEAIDICRFAHGKIVEHWGVVDRLGLIEQLGVAPVLSQAG